MTRKAIEAYEGERVSSTLVYVFEHIAKKGGMNVIKVSVLLPSEFHGCKME